MSLRALEPVPAFSGVLGPRARINWHEAHAEKLTTGDRVADHVASLIGSWTFIIGQTVIMTVWVLVNTLALFGLIRFDE